METSQSQETSELQGTQMRPPSPPAPSSHKRKLGGVDTGSVRSEPLSKEEQQIRRIDADYTHGRWCGDISAVQRILASADGGDVWACGYAALLYFYGCCAFAADGFVAEKYAKIAMAGMGLCPPAIITYIEFLLAMFLFEGIGVEVNEARALDLLRSTTDSAHTASSMYALGQVYQQGDFPDFLKAGAVMWLQQAAELQHPQALFDLGYCSTVRCYGIEINPSQAMAYFRRAAALGHGGAMNMIGLLCQHDNSDDARAFEWYKQASERLNPAGMYNLGLCLQEGIAIAQDLPRAAGLFRDAARLGYAKAQVEAGMCALNGTGVQPNDVEAVKYFQMAAQREHVEGMYRLGWCLSVGRGVDQDISRAVKYLRRAADASHVCASIELAFLLVQDTNDTEARVETEFLLIRALAALKRASQDGLYIALPDISFRRDEDGVLLRETNGLFRVCNVDPSHCTIVNEGHTVKLSRQWMLHAAPVLKVGLALLARNLDASKSTNGIDAAHLRIAMSLVHDPQGDDENYTPDIICAGGSEDMIQVAFQTIKGP